jgi:hypothetical protein
MLMRVRAGAVVVAAIAVSSCAGSSASSSAVSGSTASASSPSSSSSTVLTTASTLVRTVAPSATVALTTTAVALTTIAVPTVTQQVLYQPFTVTGVKGDVVVAKELTGSCFGSSVAAFTREDAFRCTSDTGSEILDPCFEDPFPRAPLALICTNDPTGPVIRLLLSRSTPGDLIRNTTFENQNFPWAMRLANGAFCSPHTGATGSIAGKQISWGCSDGSSVLGGFATEEPLWRVTVDNDNASSSPSVPVAVVWT